MLKQRSGQHPIRLFLPLCGKRTDTFCRRQMVIPSSQWRRQPFLCHFLESVVVCVIAMFDVIFCSRGKADIAHEKESYSMVYNENTRSRWQFTNTTTLTEAMWMLLIPGTGVWELVYSGNPPENSKWRSKQKKRLEEKQFG